MISLVLCRYIQKVGKRMILNPKFKVVNVAGEYLAIPAGKENVSTSDMICLNEATAYLLEQMKTPKTEQELVALLTAEYDVDPETAAKDIKETMQRLICFGVVTQ